MLCRLWRISALEVKLALLVSQVGLWEARMRRPVVLLFGGVAVIIATVAWPAASAEAPGDFESVRYVKQISRDRLPWAPDAMRDTEVSSHVTVDPNDPNRIVVVFEQGRFGGGLARDNGFATSHDGGRTWATSPMPRLTRVVGGRRERAGDPAAAFGPDGRVYASARIASNTYCPDGIAVQRSDDGGLNWNDPVTIEWDFECSNTHEKDWIAVDTNPASPFFGRVYLAWVQRISGDQAVVLTWSDDRGDTWSAETTVSPEDVSAQGPVMVIQPNGHVTIAYADWIDDILMAQTSRDGGGTFDPPVLISTYRGVDPADMWTGALNDRLSLAVDPTTGMLYLVWQDERFRSDDLNDVVLSRSLDGGATWSPPQRVNPDSPDSLFDHYTPAVAAHSGFVHVTYVFRDMNGGLNQEVRRRYIVSADDGITFGSELDLRNPSDLTWAARISNDYLAFFGEYVGIAATENHVYLAWPRATTPPHIADVYHQTMWSARIER
jgi:hypothetical protein